MARRRAVVVVERAILGAAMAAVAFLVERRLMRTLRRKSV